MDTLFPFADSAAALSFLSNQSSLHKLLLDELYDAVYFVYLERRILYRNYAAEALSSYAASE